MTLGELSQLYWLNKEIEADRARLAELEKMALAPSSPNLTGMPHGTGGEESRTERFVTEIDELRSKIEAKYKRCLQERIKLENYIADIPDSLTRQVFTHRFVDGMTWFQVASKIGGRNTAGSVSQLCYRFLEEHNSKK